ncbi:NAD-P-binding protein [Fomitopsis betulina]|nr:NAD-P-binding protein [Fomitopsis betulina]
MGIIKEARYLGLLIWRILFPRGDFKAEDVPDLAGRVMIVTGGNVGIGRETIKVLLLRNAKVYMASRSREKAEVAIAELRNETGREAVFLELDLSSLASVRKAASDFLSKEAELHILYNNAGVMGPPVDQVTTDGFDLQFGTNVVGHFLFTELLMPALFAAAQNSPDHHARVITTSSSAALCGHIDFASIRDGPARRRYSKEALYAQSKLANVVVAREVARRYADRGIISLSVDPGSIYTDLLRHYEQAHGIEGAVTRVFAPLVLRPASFGALTQLWAGTAPEAIHENGKYAIPVARIAPCRAEAYNDELGQELWECLAESVKEG